PNPPAPAPAGRGVRGSDLDFPISEKMENRDLTPEPAGAAGSGAAASTATGPLGPMPQVSAASWTTVVVAVYAAGLFAMLLRLTVGELRLRRFARRATVVQDAGWVDLVADSARRMGVRRSPRLLLSREQTMPLAFGTRVPSIVIPATADLWDEDRRRAVVCHELAHVARYDCLAERIATLACAAYWFHPAAWWIAH